MGVINRGLPTLPLIFEGPHFGSQRVVFPGVTEVTPVSVVSGGRGLLDAFSAGRSSFSMATSSAAAVLLVVPPAHARGQRQGY